MQLIGLIFGTLLAVSVFGNDQYEHSDIDDVTITVGNHHACVIEQVDNVHFGGEVICWGKNGKLQLDSPEGIFVQLSASTDYTCGITADSEVKCWGKRAGGFLPKIVNGKYNQVSSGVSHLCAVSVDNDITCWGHNSSAQLLVPENKYVQVCVGDSQSCALTTTGSIVCWGLARQDTLSPPKGSFIQISLSPSGLACGITVIHDMKCWGAIGHSGESHSEESDGSGHYELFRGPFIQVSSGSDFACAIRGNGLLHCIGNTRKVWKHKNSPSKDVRISEISISDNDNVCTITTEHKVLCWGDSDYVTQYTDDLNPATHNEL